MRTDDVLSAGQKTDPGLLALELQNERYEMLRLLFRDAGARVPTVVWSPLPRDLPHPLANRFLALCESVADEDGLVVADRFGAMDLRELRDHVMELEPVDGTGRFRYAYYGAEIAATFGTDMTGRYSDEFSGHISAFFNALYMAVMARKEMVLSVHEPPRAVFATTWTRLICPLVSDNGEIARIAAVNIPDNDLRVGLEAMPDPVFVTAPGQQILFANTAAQTIFGQRSFMRMPISFEEYCGFTAPSPEASDQRGEGWAREERSATLSNTLIVHFSVTARQVSYRGRALGIVVVKQI